MPDPFDPGIHDQMGRRFPPFGIGIVDMVVEGELVPLFGHFQEMVLGQFRPDQPGIAGRDHAEVMGELELAQFIVPAAQQILHDLQQNPRGILLIKGGRGEKHLVAQGPQGLDPVEGLALLLKRTEQTGNGVGNAQAPRGGHLLDAVGMHMLAEQGAHRLGFTASFQNIVDDAEKFVVVFVEKYCGGLVFHRTRKKREEKMNRKTIGDSQSILFLARRQCNIKMS
ncbi:MAG: hypothetical protein ACD_75C00102G0002 [uncultured bacterium]|nr:MAG: hypothetical protein ACD_75C00102G0002 [uncultured bacterium]